MKTAAVVLAGGRGRRMGKGSPKGFLPLRGLPMFLYPLRALVHVKEVQRIVVVVPPGWEERAKGDLRGLGQFPKVVPGGETRQESSLRGLRALEDWHPDYVLIHDGARPLLKAEMIKRMLKVAPKAATFALQATETLVEAEGDHVKRVLDRSRVRHIQTPQGFPYKEILEAHLRAKEEGFSEATDDATLLLRYGGEVLLLPGEPYNIKVTHPEDLRIAEALLEGARALLHPIS